jgi:hypothetical protein
MMWRWISEVPSQMRPTQREAPSHRDTGKDTTVNAC